MGDTSIEWTDITVNCVLARAEGSKATKGGYQSGVGHYCEKIGPDCKNCYSSGTQPRFGLPVFQEQRRGGVEVFFAPERMLPVLRRREPTKVFWNDMTDTFGHWVPFEWIAAMYAVMLATPQHSHQVLTKRPARRREFIKWLGDGGIAPFVRAHPEKLRDFFAAGSRFETYRGRRVRSGKDAWAMILNASGCSPHGSLPNVWEGVSCGNQATANERIPDMLATPANVRFVSYEPAIGGVDFTHVHPTGFPHDVYDALRGLYRGGLDVPHLDWVIVGSESGHGARPMDVDWARSAVDQCMAAGVAVFTKQIATPGHAKGGDPALWPAGEWPRQFPEER